MSHYFPENKQQRTPQLSPFQGHAFYGTHVDVSSHTCTYSLPHPLLSPRWAHQKHMVRKSPHPSPQLLSRGLGPRKQAEWEDGLQGAGIQASGEERKHTGGSPQKKKHKVSPLKSLILESAWTQLSMLVGIQTGAADCPRKSNLPSSVPSWAELPSLHSPAQSHIFPLKLGLSFCHYIYINLDLVYNSF